MIVLEKEGDLVRAFKDVSHELFDGIAHGANCFHAMRSGIAATIAEQIPEMLKADYDTKHGDKEKLGGFSKAVVKLGDYMIQRQRVGYNLYTQFYPGPDARNEAVFKAFKAMNDDLKLPGFRAKIAVPLIGCGIGGLKWDDVKRIIDYTTPDVDIIVFHYKK